MCLWLPPQCRLLHSNLGPTQAILSRQKAIATLHGKFVLYVKLFPRTLALVSSPYSTVSGNPELPLTLFAIWNCDSVNFPKYFTVRCPRRGLPRLPLAQMLGLGPAREEGPNSCLLMNGHALAAGKSEECKNKKIEMQIPKIRRQE